MLAAIIAVFAVLADQLSKHFVVQAAQPVEGNSAWSSDFIPGIMSFIYRENRGAAFSMLSDNRWVFMSVSAVAMAIILYLLIKEYRRHVLLNISLAMVLGGGIGNMIDRIRLGYVVDFFKTEFVDFAIFNVADCFITVGAILLGVYVVFFEVKVEKRLQAEEAAKKAAEAAIAENNSAEPEKPVENEGENG